MSCFTRRKPRAAPEGRSAAVARGRDRDCSLCGQFETRDELIARDKAAVGGLRPQPLHILVLGAFDVEHCGMQARVAGWWRGHETAPLVFFHYLFFNLNTIGTVTQEGAG
jgi:hypothetical protein